MNPDVRRLILNQNKGSCPSDAMFPIEPLWACVSVPAILVSILILIKLRQEKMDKRAMNTLKREAKVAQTPEEASGRRLVEAEDNHKKPESSTETKPQDCNNYLGYLYMRKAPDKTSIPSECYNCPKLLQCLYSPNIVEKIYG